MQFSAGFLSLAFVKSSVGGIALASSDFTGAVLGFTWRHKCKLAFVAGVSYIGLRIGQQYWSIHGEDLKQRVRSNVIDMFSTHLSEDHALGGDIRDMFRTISLPPLSTIPQNHSHATAARLRTAMNHAIDDYIIRCGRSVYSVSMSQADVRAGFAGNRFYWRNKDVALDIRDDAIKPHHMVKMSDTSYYLDLPKYLALGNTTLLCELDPAYACGTMADAYYSFNRDNEIVERICGDAVYQHALWNHHMDSVTVHTWCGAYTYYVEKIRHPEFPQYAIIAYFMKRWTWAPASWLLGETELKRREVVCGDWVTVKALHSEGGYGVPYISIARVDSTAQAFCPRAVFEMIMTRLHVTKHADMGSVEGLLELELKAPPYALWRKHVEGSANSLRVTATVLWDFFVSQGKVSDDQLTYPTPWGFTPINESYRPMTTPPRDSMRSILPPGKTALAKGAAVPTMTAASMRGAVDGRINSVANHVVPPARYIGYASEFLDRLIPSKFRAVGVPVSLDEVYERQHRPTQRRILDRLGGWLGSDRQRYSIFMKREAYGAVNHPRVISQVPGTFKREYSAGMYAFARDIMKPTNWYAFGRAPSDSPNLEGLLANKASGCTRVVATDFSKFDGRVSQWLRDYVERPCLYRYFAEPYASRMVKLHDDQLGWKGMSRLKIGTNPGAQRGSGSPETSIFNSVINAYTNYCAFRNLGCDPDEAYARLGVYGGDDGVTFDIEPEVLEGAASDLGMSLTVEALPLSRAVPFLGRLWFNLNTTVPSSCADVARQVVKLHLTTTDESVPLEEVVRAKALGFKAIDSQTPVLGVFCQKALELTQPKHADQQEDMIRGETSWYAMEGYVFAQPPRDQCMRELGRLKVGSDVIGNMEAHILAATNVADLFPDAPFVDWSKPPKTKALQGGAVVEPPAAAPIAAPKAQASATAVPSSHGQQPPVAEQAQAAHAAPAPSGAPATPLPQPAPRPKKRAKTVSSDTAPAASQQSVAQPALTGEQVIDLR
jgi:hypothetical protein